MIFFPRRLLLCCAVLCYIYVCDMKVTKWTSSSQAPPMFVSMILDPIWQLYDAAVRDKNGAKAGRMAGKLGLDIPPRELSSSDPRTVLQVGQEPFSGLGRNRTVLWVEEELNHSLGSAGTVQGPPPA